MSLRKARTTSVTTLIRDFKPRSADDPWRVFSGEKNSIPYTLIVKNFRLILRLIWHTLSKRFYYYHYYSHPLSFYGRKTIASLSGTFPVKYIARNLWNKDTRDNYSSKKYPTTTTATVRQIGFMNGRGGGFSSSRLSQRVDHCYDTENVCLSIIDWNIL